MCAAPGMKTTHVAALMENRGKIYAVERDPKRYELLRNTIKLSGAKCVETLLADSLTIESRDVPGVQYILVDPSCSGSGIVDRIELEPEKSSNPSRLYKLGGFQIKLLHHALTKFPFAKKVIYSTCSLNVEENEEVVSKVMSYFPDPPEFKLVKKILPDGWKNRGSNQYAGGKYCLYSRPEEDLTNGFFIAVFERYNFPNVKGKYADKCIGNSEKSEVTGLKIPDTNLPQSEIACSHDILKDYDKKSKHVKHHKKIDKLKKSVGNATTLKENIGEQSDGPTRKVTVELCQVEHFEKKGSGKRKYSKNLSHETELENFGPSIKATEPNSPQENISICLLDNANPTVNIVSEKSHIGSNILSKDGNGNRTKKADADDDLLSVKFKQKKPKITSESYVCERLDKPGSRSCELKKHDSELNIPKKLVNIKKKKKKFSEKSNVHDNMQAFEDSNMLNERDNLQQKRTFHSDGGGGGGGGSGSGGSVNVLGSVAKTYVNNVISDGYDCSFNKFSRNLEDTGHSKKKEKGEIR